MEKKKGLVSIIMLSRDNANHVVDSIKSVQAQTYKNWELIFLDDKSNDDTITQLMELKEHDSRLIVYQTVEPRGMGVNRLSAMKEIKGEWLAFLDTGDLWEPTKLERQIEFMNSNGYKFSYTNYTLIDEKWKRNYLVSGPAVIDEKELQKCYWMGGLTVMCNTSLIRSNRVRVFNDNNDYALWLLVIEFSNCYLLNENLATNMARRSFVKKLPLLRKIEWRFEVYRKIEDLTPIVSAYMTIRNFYYSAVKRFKFMKRINTKSAIIA